MDRDADANPFQYGGVVTEESFCNRKKELAEVLRVMENSGRAFLYSERRFGKTSLVQLALKKLKKKRNYSACVSITPFGNRRCGQVELLTEFLLPGLVLVIPM